MIFLINTVNTPTNMNVIVAIIDLNENLPIPLIPCPLVQPPPILVPIPTNKPASINKRKELSKMKKYGRLMKEVAWYNLQID